MTHVSPPLRFATSQFFALVVVLTLNLDASAEVPAGFGLGARAGVVTLDTDSWPFADVDPGLGFDGFIRYAPSTRFVMGAGVTYGPKFTTRSSGRDLDRIGLYLEPRFELSTQDSRAGFFVGGRIGVEDLDMRKGPYAGATTGLTYFVAPHIGIEAAGVFNFILEPGDLLTYRSIGLSIGVVSMGL